MGRQRGRKVGGGVELGGLLPAQYQKYQPQHFLGDGHDGFLMRFSHHQTTVFGRQGTLGHARGVGAFAQDEANVVR